MIELKNKKVNLFGTEWQIRFEDKLMDPTGDHEIFGDTYRSANNIITIAKTIDGVPVPKAELEVTLLHELVHAIFVTGQYHNSNNDEPLVEWCARCLKQLIDKKII